MHGVRNEHCYELMNGGVWIKVLTTFVSRLLFLNYFTRDLEFAGNCLPWDETECTNWHIDL